MSNPFILLLCILCTNYFEQHSRQHLNQNLPAADWTTVTDSNWRKITLKKPACRGKKIYIRKGNDNGVYLDGNSFFYKPGDTLVLSAANNPYSYFSIGNFRGTENCPLTIINEGGQVTLNNGMALENCNYINITGTGSSKEQYGFRIEDPSSNGVGIDIHGRSSFIEIQHFFIYKKTYGLWVKEEGSCIDSLQYPNWTINNIYIHNNKIIKMNQEGMYLGSTDPNGSRQIACNGKIINPKPLRLGNIKVYNNIIDSTNRSGIQLSCGSGMLNEIFNNTVTNCGFEFNTSQGNGISLGGYTQAKVYKNSIDHTYALGILCLGSGKILIRDNVINNSGELSDKKVGGMAGIMVDTRPTDPAEATQFFILNNKIGKNTDYAIRVYRTVDSYAKGNIICNNSGNVKVDKAVNWISNCAPKK